MLRDALRGAPRRAPDRPRLRRRRALQPGPPPGADRAWPPTLGVAGPRRPRLHRRARHARRPAARATSRSSRTGARRPATRASARVIGRYFAMDRDKRWDRIQQAYDLLVHGRAEHHVADRAGRPPRDAYDRGETDEFITATTVGDEARDPPRRQRHRASTSAPTACARSRARWPSPASPTSTAAAAPLVERYACLTEYEEGWPYPVAFPPERPEHHAAARDRRARAARQLHVAETEKYPHVTYFFGGGEEAPERRRAPRARALAARRADLRPQAEMSAREAADAFVGAWREDAPRFGIINFANPDMVGHTGVIPAAVDGGRDRRRAAWATSSRRCRSPAACCSSPPTTATPTTCSSDDGSPEHRALAEPGAAASSPSTGLELRDGGHPRRRRADGARSCSASTQPAGDDRRLADRLSRQPRSSARSSQAGSSADRARVDVVCGVALVVGDVEAAGSVSRSRAARPNSTLITGSRRPWAIHDRQPGARGQVRRPAVDGRDEAAQRDDAGGARAGRRRGRARTT